MALTPARDALTVAVVNPTSEARSVAVDVRGARTAGEGTSILITGKDKWSYNAPGQPRGVRLTRSTVPHEDGGGAAAERGAAA